MSHVHLPSQTRPYLVLVASVLFLIGVVACSGGGVSSAPPGTSTGTPGAEEDVGERLFLDTRFAQAFKVFLDNGGKVNDPKAGDGVVDTVETLGAPIAPGPFKGMSMN